MAQLWLEMNLLDNVKKILVCVCSLDFCAAIFIVKWFQFMLLLFPCNKAVLPLYTSPSRGLRRTVPLICAQTGLVFVCCSPSLCTNRVRVEGCNRWLAQLCPSSFAHHRPFALDTALLTAGQGHCLDTCNGLPVISGGNATFAESCHCIW